VKIAQPVPYLGQVFLLCPLCSQKVESRLFLVNDEKKEPSVLDRFKATKFRDGLKFEGVLAEVAIGKIFSEVMKENKGLVEVYFLSRVGKDGVSSYPSTRKIEIELTEGVDAYTALTYIMEQALWHWQVVGDKLFIVPWGSSEDGWSISE